MSDDEERPHSTEPHLDMTKESLAPFYSHSRQMAETPVRFSLRTLLLSTTAFALIFMGVRIGWERTQQNMLGSHIRNKLKQIHLGLLNYDSADGSLPPANQTDSRGIAQSSWRFAIPSFMESWSVRRDRNAAWNAPSNSAVLAISFLPFCWDESSSSNLNTSIFAVAGPGTAFPLLQGTAASDIPPNTIMLVESAESMTHWMEPGDYDVTELLAATDRLGNTAKGILPDRIHILFADGEVWALSPDMPMTALHPFLTITGAKNADRDELLASYRVE
jgi:hypothetical protein